MSRWTRPGSSSSRLPMWSASQQATSTAVALISTVRLPASCHPRRHRSQMVVAI
ncbi:MAG TPA: hypothetical protein VM734_22550 [Kofleriaceae bacterium]|nr:hypothetical protein [Kofleriaceae bacterium]